MSFQKLMWKVAGANPEILKNCPTDYFKFSAIGAVICVTALAAFCSGTAAAWYFMSDSSGSGNFGVAMLFGLGWSVLIYCIDRCLVITMKKDPTLKRQRWVVPFFLRFLLAAVVALMVSVPLELYIFRDYIAANEEEFLIYESSKLGDVHRSLSHEDDYRADSRNAFALSEQFGNEAGVLQTEINTLQSRINRLEAEKSNPSSSAYITARNAYNSALAAYNEAKRQYKSESEKAMQSQSVLNAASAKMTSNRSIMSARKAEMNKAAAAWKAQKQKEIDSLTPELAQKKTDKAEKESNRAMAIKSWQQSSESAHKAAEQRSESESVKKEQLRKGNDFIRNFQILEFTVNKKDANGNRTEATQWFALWLVRLVFLIVELLPKVVKIATPIGSYDRYVHAMEESMDRYLNSLEFQEDMQKINGAATQLKVEEDKMRLEAELKIKKELIDKVASVQLDIARLAIKKWEENERRKLSQPVAPKPDNTQRHTRPKPSKPHSQPSTNPVLNATTASVMPHDAHNSLCSDENLIDVDNIIE